MSRFSPSRTRPSMSRQLEELHIFSSSSDQSQTPMMVSYSDPGVGNATLATIGLTYEVGAIPSLSYTVLTHTWCFLVISQLEDEQ